MSRKVPMYWRYHGAPHGLHLAMRQGDWKILAAGDFSRFELYNLRDDPRESVDLAGKEPERFETMKSSLIDLNTRVESEGPEWWKGYGRGKQRGESRLLAKGKDRTSSFDIVRGCVVSAGELGFELEADGEGFALKKLENPIERKAEFRTRYRAATDARTRNAFLVLGSTPENAALLKCGTAIGMGAHCVFQGAWSRLRTGARLEAPVDGKKTFDLRVGVDLEKRTVKAVIDGKTVTARLPDGLKTIEYYGYYVKGTRSAFGPVTVAR